MELYFVSLHFPNLVTGHSYKDLDPDFVKPLLTDSDWSLFASVNID